MEARLVLVPEEEVANYGRVKPVMINGGTITYGLSVGTWSVSDTDGRIHIVLNGEVDNIIHEVATRKGARVELRAAEKAAKGEEIKPTIILDPKTKRFKEVW